MNIVEEIWYEAERNSQIITKPTFVDILPKNNMRYIYILLSQGTVVYIGQTKRIIQRWSEHLHSNKIFNQAFYFAVSVNEVNKIEGYLIGIYQPRYNKKHIKSKMNYNATNILGKLSPEQIEIDALSRERVFAQSKWREREIDALATARAEQEMIDFKLRLSTPLRREKQTWVENIDDLSLGKVRKKDESPLSILAEQLMR